MKWEVVKVFYPAPNPYLAFDLNQAGRQSTKEQPERKKGLRPTVEAAVEVSVLLRSVKKLRRECDAIKVGGSVE
jgi:hypothetical protein